MTPPEIQQLKVAYVQLAAYYGQPIEDEILLLYVEDLRDLHAPTVLSAMTKLRRQPGRRSAPLPADIRQLCEIQPANDASRANQIAGKICEAITKDGYTNAARARDRMGEIGWRTVELLGGWQHLCNSLTSAQARTFFAQARDVAKSVIDGAAQPEHRALASPKKVAAIASGLAEHLSARAL